MVSSNQNNAICAVPCEAMDTRLAAVWTCLRAKVTTKVFFSLIIPLFGFVVIVIGGAQWAIYEKVNEIKTEMAVANEHMTAVQVRMDAHILFDATRHHDMEEEMERFHPWRK